MVLDDVREWGRLACPLGSNPNPKSYKNKINLTLIWGNPNPSLIRKGNPNPKSYKKMRP